jgi:hypothetical protein
MEDFRRRFRDPNISTSKLIIQFSNVAAEKGLYDIYIYISHFWAKTKDKILLIT